ncbi:hypothetical protein NHX12_034540 [Muraenolepis orangiensis]|uniref:TIR domain-containing protein n=1 Tax=Muraenolepis orangiensis TaxID=630683 RepID=A0A9Q0I2M0_9TELE|nr:hypothetical protein NHX12_034540 [Muraenolepis orangiensis]
MQKKIVHSIVTSSSKLSVLMDEASSISHKSAMIVNVKVSVDGATPELLFLELVELESQRAKDIEEALLNCLDTAGFTEEWLQKNWVSFVSDGASVMLGKNSGVATRLTARYPNLFTWHCMNHRLELAVSDAVDEVQAVNHFKVFLEKIHNLYSQSNRNSRTDKRSTLLLSNTNLRSLDFLLHANLTELEFLQVRQDAFSVISEPVMQSLPALVYLDMQGNSFTCDCDNAWFLQWVITNKQTQVSDAYNFECNFPPNLKGRKLLELDVRSCTVDVGFVCYISTACAVMVVMAVSFTHHFLQWHLVYAYYLLLAFLYNTKHKDKRAHPYDAFVSYNANDEHWVLGELLPKLEDEQGWRLCLHHRDFQPGKPIMENITDAIYGSRKTICVISHDYLASEWCSREIQVASFRLFDEQKDVLILVFLEDIPMQQLSPYHRMRRLLKRQTYLSWSRAVAHPDLFWEKLRQALETREDPAGEHLLLSVGDGIPGERPDQ